MRSMNHLLLLVGLVFTTVEFSEAQAPAGVRIAPELSINRILQIASESGEGTSRVALALVSGVKLEGVVGVCGVQPQCTIHHADGSTTAVSLSQVAAVTVIDPGKAKVALRGGKIYRENSDEVPTALAIKRSVASLKSQLGVEVSLAVEDSELSSDDCRFSLQRVLSALEVALKDVTQDALGRQALAEKAKSMRITSKSGVPLEFLPLEGSLELQFDCQAPLAGDYQNEILSGLKAVL